MNLSRQESTRTSGERKNQKARTRSAILSAAMELVREGRPASIQEAADRALVSVATAYRYFPSADDLWWEASVSLIDYQPAVAEAFERVEAAGSDPQARLEALIRLIGFAMLEHPAPL